MPISEKQLQILAFPFTSYDALICDGAIRSGKTSWMMIAFIEDAMRRFNNQRFGICGKTVDSAKKNLIVPWMGIKKFRHKYKIVWKTQEKVLEVSTRDGRRANVFEVFGGKDEASYQLIQGRTLAGILLDEVALMPESFVNQATSRCSVDGSKMWFNCNPAAPNHWFKTGWIDKCKERNALHLHFLLSDNPSLSDKIVQRYENMYAGVFYKRYIQGLWVLAEGLVYDFFNDDCITDDQPAGSRYYISIDYGTNNPFAALLWSVTPERAVCINEYYFSGRDAKKDARNADERAAFTKTDAEYRDEVVKLAGEHKIDFIVLDPSAASFKAELRRNTKFAVKDAKNDVLDGIRGTAAGLKSGKIKIHRSCKNTIREFGAYSWDEKKSTDAVIKENDHCLTGDTLVHTEDGAFPIRNLVGKSGKVWSFNIHTGKKELKPFFDCRLTQRKAQIYKITTKDGRTIRCTGEHPILTNRGYVQAKHLNESDMIIDISD